MKGRSMTMSKLCLTNSKKSEDMEKYLYLGEDLNPIIN